MRNTTKLNHLLMLYDLTFSMDELLTLTIVHKSTGQAESFTDTAYAKVVQKAYSFMKKEVKNN
jgi:hypothetical protein